ncbi:hypothetical protein Afil01_15440 [Actinorhabdospora filicis]|uniref:ABC transporter domain-containing protein n=1 Tax=Actinorhabdospora filicis TaxID=1785913 RepID=A0A9W6SIT0_9ACTN|nr:ABC transporter ATP-binding protein [Actinorhabdospora filicis]GLZ76737.1 hypothetical protein Afil01_15440 [Actinorhabdospora filicis]
MIELNHVTRAYDAGPPALNNASLSVAAGESVAVLGPSGSGKSTLLNLIAGLDRPDSGTVTVDGVRVDGMSETAAAKHRRARIGMVFQFFHLLDDLTVTENVLLPARLLGLSRKAAEERAKRLLDDLGVGRFGDTHPARLSGGQRQRVAVARALMNRPPVLLADEPTGALDSAAGAEVAGLMKDLHADGHTIVLVTHDLALAEACATRTVRLADGEVLG